jgi:beta-lactam-binding protein with PASTA domain
MARHEDLRELPTSVPLEAPAIVTTAGPASGAGTVPDLTGMSARDALRVLARLGISAKLRGVGVVTAQEPAAGTPIDADVRATLRLERQPATVVVSSAKS